MKIRELIEAPISDIDIIGTASDEHDTRRTFSKKDVGPVQSVQGLKKIKNMYRNVPYDFNFYLVSIKRNKRGAAILDPNEAAELIGAERVKKLNSNSITIIFTHNITNQQNYVPFTGWMLTHRISHIFQFMATTGETNVEVIQPYLDFESHLFRGMLKGISTILNESTNIKEYKLASIESFGDGFLNRHRRWLLRKLFTMRSARQGKLTNTLDLGGELMAQFLLTGKITFNRLTENDRVNLTPEKLKAINNLIAEYEVKLNEIAKQIFDSIKGRILIW